MTQHVFRPIIELWRPRSKLSDRLDLPLNTVQAWWNRDSIPSHALRGVADAAEAELAAGNKEFRYVDLGMLLDAAEKRASKPKPGEEA